MLKKSVWNKPNVLTTENERVGADSGYWTTAYINITKPYTQTELARQPGLKLWNKTFNQERSMIERGYCFLKQWFSIFDQPWRREKKLFPLALRVALKLSNRYWREPNRLPIGLQKQMHFE